MIFDTGPLVAAANRADPWHESCARLIRTRGDIVVPGPVVAEAGFLIAKMGGAGAESAFLRSLSADPFTVVAPDPLELRRAAELVSMYGDLPLGSTDAIVMAMTESRNDPRVATLDRRHFSIVRPIGLPAFQVLPDEDERR